MVRVKPNMTAAHQARP